MPSSRTYQAIGYMTYHSWRRELRRRAPVIKRNVAAAAVVALAIAAAAHAARGEDPPAAS